MPDMPLVSAIRDFGRTLCDRPWRRLAGVSSWVLILLLSACRVPPPPAKPLALKLHQTWELQPGDQLHGYAVLGGLGDISIALRGQSVYAPFDGKTEQDTRQCLVFSSPEVPAYLFRLCGVQGQKLGAIARGESMGTADILQFAALRKQPNNTWAMVEPSKSILERTLTRS
jgi:hypothetical protein